MMAVKHIFSVMNKLPNDKRAEVLHMLVEGSSMRAIARVTGVAFNTIVKLLLEAGEACSAYQDRTFHNLSCKRLQLDEIWSFIRMKERNVPVELKGTGVGDVWTWTAIDADTKLVPAWFVGSRDSDAATQFVCDLSKRLANRVQITTDGHRAYLEAVETAFGSEIDYAMLVKIYGQAIESQARYSPPQIIGTQTKCCTGKPDPKHISTSYAERQNLTMRMSMRRFTRLTNGHSKKLANHCASLALYFAYYNFVRINQAVRMTPAMAAGVTSKLWEMSDLLAMVDAYWAGQKSN